MKIQVIPRRKYEPLFRGYINIVDGDWRIHSIQLLLTKESQMQFVDSMKVEQLYRPLKNDVWAISSQVIYPSVKLLGFDAHGSFREIQHLMLAGIAIFEIYFSSQYPFWITPDA